MILEELELAKRRGALISAELVGTYDADALHMTMPMKLALEPSRHAKDHADAAFNGACGDITLMDHAPTTSLNLAQADLWPARFQARGKFDKVVTGHLRAPQDGLRSVLSAGHTSQRAAADNYYVNRSDCDWITYKVPPRLKSIRASIALVWCTNAALLCKEEGSQWSVVPLLVPRN